MQKYTYSGLGALDRKVVIGGGMVVALGVIGFLAYRAKKKADADNAAAAAAAAATSSSSGKPNTAYYGYRQDQSAASATAGRRTDYQISV